MGHNKIVISIPLIGKKLLNLSNGVMPSPAKKSAGKM
jgi:hypothetical protein